MDSSVTGAPPDPGLAAALPLDGMEEEALRALIPLCAEEAMATPENPRVWYLLGQVYFYLGELEDAVIHLRTVTCLDPDNPAGQVALAEALHLQGDTEGARAALEAALLAHPRHGPALQGLARLTADTAPSEALNCLNQALRADPPPTAAERHGILARQGDLQRRLGQVEAAAAAYQAALTIHPNPYLRIKDALLLPPVYRSLEEVHQWRARLSQGLDAALEALRADSQPAGDPIQMGAKNNFFLVYQGENDCGLQTRLAEAYHRAWRGDQPWPEAPRPAPAGTRLRVGWVSAYFCRHTIGELFGGLVSSLPPADFDTYVYHLGEQFDELTAGLQARVPHFHQLRSPRLEDWVRLIGSHQLDVLIFTDLGMEPLSYFLAFHRLAPVQCVTWGHPVTSGLPTVDYYLTSRPQETPESAAHYREQPWYLERPLIGIDPVSPLAGSPPPLDPRHCRKHLGLGEQGRIYGCMQSLFKFHPAFDASLEALFAADPAARLLIPGAGSATPPLQTVARERLNARWKEHCPHLSRAIVEIPHQTYSDYLASLAACDLILDPSPFGGAKTSLDAFFMGKPVLTLGGELMRSRATLALGQGGAGTVAVATPTAYAETAQALADASPTPPMPFADWRHEQTRQAGEQLAACLARISQHPGRP